MDKRFLSIVIAIVLIFVGFFAFNKNSNTTSSSGSATSHIAGKGAKGVTLIEYGDYECPVCKSYYQPLKEAMAVFGDNAYFQFRNLPLTQIHKNAFSSARAAEAAGLQNKYFEMHDQLYENQDQTGQTGWVVSSNPLDDYYVKYAEAIGLNIAQFKQDYASSKVNDSINADLAEFKKTGQQQATPTFFLDGKYIENSKFTDDKTSQVSVAKITALVNEAVSKK